MNKKYNFSYELPTPSELKKPLERAIVKCYKRNPVVKRKDLISQIIYGECFISPELISMKHWNGDRKIDHMIDIAISNDVSRNRIFRMNRGEYTLTDKQFDLIF